MANAPVMPDDRYRGFCGRGGLSAHYLFRGIVARVVAADCDLV
jgi:hypothetical protein